MRHSIYMVLLLLVVFIINHHIGHVLAASLPAACTISGSSNQALPSGIKIGNSMCAGAYFTCFVEDSGALYCWGDSRWGQTTPPSGSYVSVTCGYNHACAISYDGNAICWGDNTQYQSTVPRLDNVQWVMLSAGYQVTCGIVSDGTIRCWGQDALLSLAPPSIITGLTGMGIYATDLSCGYQACCLIDSTTRVRCWGSDTGLTAPTPTDTGYRQVVCTRDNAFAIKTATNTLFGWGTTAASTFATSTLVSISGGWGDTAEVNRLCGVQFDGTIICFTNSAGGLTKVPARTDFVNVVAGYEHSCAQIASRNVTCWTDNNDQQVPLVAYNQLTARSNPVYTNVDVGSQVGGNTYACAITNVGTIKCWGFGPVYDAYTANLMTPAGTGDTWTMISANINHMCALDTAGKIKCFGDAAAAGSASDAALVAKQGSYNWVYTGTRHSCAKDTLAAITCWCGTGYSSPACVSPSSSTTFGHVALGTGFTCGYTAFPSLKVKCWGDATIYSAWLSQFETMTASMTVNSITAGATWACVVRNDVGPYLGAPICYSGADGDWPGGYWPYPGVSTETVITQRYTTTNVIALQAGDNYVCGVLSDGTTNVFCFGRGGATLPGLSPVRLQGGSRNSYQYSLNQGGCAVHYDGGISCWGNYLRFRTGGSFSLPRCSPASQWLVDTASTSVDGSWCGNTGFYPCATLAYALQSNSTSTQSVYSTIVVTGGQTHTINVNVTRPLSLTRLGQRIQILSTGSTIYPVLDCGGGSCLRVSAPHVSLYNIGITGGRPGIKVVSGGLWVKDCQFQFNYGTVDQPGSAISYGAGTMGGLLTTDFNYHRCAGDGGAIGASFASLSIVGCTFTQNNATGSGGALWSLASTIVMSSSSFIKNRAHDNGAAIAMDRGTLTMSSVSSSYNDARLYGGFLYATSAAVITMTGASTHTTNVATNGGMFHLRRGTRLTASAQTITRHIAVSEIISTTSQQLQQSARGGVITVDDSTASFDSCTFTDNGVQPLSSVTAMAAIYASSSPWYYLRAWNGFYMHADTVNVGVVYATSVNDPTLGDAWYWQTQPSKNGQVVRSSLLTGFGIYCDPGGSSPIGMSNDNGPWQLFTPVVNTTTGTVQFYQTANPTLYIYELNGRFYCNVASYSYERSIFTMLPVSITDGSGGGIGYCSQTSNGGTAGLSFTGGSITNSITTGFPGGVLYTTTAVTGLTGQYPGCSISMTGVTVTGSAGTSGGVIYARGGSIAINGSTFTNNQASYRGSVLYTFDTSITVASSSFGSNTAVLSGGSPFWCDIQGVTYTDTNTSFTSNTGLWGISSQPASSPYALSFVQRPLGEQNAGDALSPPYNITLYDQWSNLIPESQSQPMIVSLTQPVPASASLSGTNTRSFVNGMVSFGAITGTTADLALAAPTGNVYNLTFSHYTILTNGTTRRLSLTDVITVRHCIPGEYYNSAANVARCVLCSAGKFTNTNGSLACDSCAYGTYSAAIGATACSNCTTGTYSSDLGRTTCLDCPCGTFASIAGSSVCSPCHPGTHNNETGKSICQGCGTGRYSDEYGLAVCPHCPLGYYTDDTAQTVCKPCIAGTYLSATMIGASICRNCDSGHYSSSGSAECIPCSAGDYQPVTGQSACIPCDIGSYQHEIGSSACHNCTHGTYADTQGLSQCLPCLPGHFTAGNGSIHCMACDIGYHQPSAGASSCTNCSIGYYSDSLAAVTCTICPVGTHSFIEGAINCTGCDAGSAGLNCAICTPGFYAPEPSMTACLPCPPGSYQFDYNATSCIPCSVGYAQKLSGQVECDACAVGHHANEEGLCSCLPCPQGSYTNSTATIECHACAPGTAQSLVGQISCDACAMGSATSANGSVICTPCDAGYAASSTGATECTICTPGHYSIRNGTNGAEECVPCAAGTYINDYGHGGVCYPCSIGKATNLTGQTDCTPCALGTTQSSPGQQYCQPCDAGHASSDGITCASCVAGKYAPSSGYATCIACNANEYSLSGATNCTSCTVGNSTSSACASCPIGGYTNAQGLCTPCEIGKYQDVAGQPECEPCAMGSFSASISTVKCTLCDSGSFINTTGNSECWKCPVGRYSVKSLTMGATRCDACSAGTYAHDEGTSSCTSCPVGKFMASNNGASICTDCDQGRYQSVTGATECFDCLYGTYAPTTGLVVCLACPIGTITAVNGSSSCSACGGTTNGMVALTQGLSSCSPCSVGYIASSPKTCSGCQPGTFNNGSTTTCINCIRGRYASMMAQTVCDACATGKYSAFPGQLQCTNCGIGHEATATGSTICSLCTDGTIASNEGTSSCTPCGSGTVMDPTLRNKCMGCAPGSYNDGTTTTCINCEVGKANSQVGQSSCTPCAMGSAIGVPGSNTCEKCIPGWFTNTTNNQQCTKCAPGRYESGVGSTACSSCAAGSAAATWGLPICTPCNPGYYSHAGSIECNPCELGTASSGYGAADTCRSCAIGYYANATGLIECVAAPIGYYAPTLGTIQPLPCARGTFASDIGTSECTLCGSGSYAYAMGQTQCNDCAAGTYVLASTPPVPIINCTSCPIGRHQSALHSTSCTDCVAGRFSSSTGAIECTPCSGVLVAPRSAMPICLSCPVNTVARDGISCLCDVGYFQRTIGIDTSSSNDTLSIICQRCVDGQVCNTIGVREDTLETAVGWWKLSNTSFEYTRCLRTDHCQGGIGTAIQCSSNRNGVLCADCISGYRAESMDATCTKCLDQGGNLGVGFFLLALYLALLIALYIIALRQPQAPASQSGFQRDNDVGVAVVDQMRGEGIQVVGGTPPLLGVGVASPSSAPNSVPPSPHMGSSAPLSPLSPWHGGNTSDDHDHEPGLVPFGPLDGGSPTVGGPPPSFDGHHQVEGITGGDHGENTTVTGGKAKKQKEPLPPSLVPELRHEDRLPRSPVSMMKIGVTFFQIMTNLTAVVTVPWPNQFQTFVGWFNFTNFDFIPWHFFTCYAPSSLDYYAKLRILVIFPVALLLVIVVFCMVPIYCLNRRDMADDPSQRNGRRKWQRRLLIMILFTLFLVFPGLSNHVLSLFICRDINGTSYLVADFSIECYNNEWDNHVPYAIIGAILYPIGIPVLFGSLMYYNRHRLHHRRNQPSRVQPWLGFLYDAYDQQVWWWELVDMAVKLILGVLLVVLPLDYQMPVGMCVAFVYIVALLIVSPYIRYADDRAHLFALNAIFVFLLAGLFLQKHDSMAGTTNETLLSILFIAMIIIGFIATIFSIGWFARAKERENERAGSARLRRQASSLRGGHIDAARGLAIDPPNEMSTLGIEMIDPRAAHERVLRDNPHHHHGYSSSSAPLTPATPPPRRALHLSSAATPPLVPADASIGGGSGMVLAPISHNTRRAMVDAGRIVAEETGGPGVGVGLGLSPSLAPSSSPAVVSSEPVSASSSLLTPLNGGAADSSHYPISDAPAAGGGGGMSAISLLMNGSHGSSMATSSPSSRSSMSVLPHAAAAAVSDGDHHEFELVARHHGHGGGAVDGFDHGSTVEGVPRRDVSPPSSSSGRAIVAPYVSDDDASIFVPVAAPAPAIAPEPAEGKWG